MSRNRKRKREKRTCIMAGTNGIRPRPIPDHHRPSWQELRQITDRVAKSEREWAGFPMPIPEAALVVADKHPAFARLNGVQLGVPARKVPKRCEFINSWYSKAWKAFIYLWRENGRTEWGPVMADGHGALVGSWLTMVGISMTMDVDAERRAMETLRTLVSPQMARAYEITGRFFETSKRSGVKYLFRRLAPTIAFRISDGDRGPGECRFLAALCLHPIAYYEALPMVAMCPTDDVIAHLVMMRADEVMFWRKSNQHGVDSPGAQL